MKFKENILDNKDCLLSSLNSRIGALKSLGKVASFKTRKLTADGIFMSKLTYLIELWGGCAEYLLDSLQKTQNRAARAVTRLDWFTPSRELLNQCGWLSVRQLVVYHSVMLVFKIIKAESPRNIHSMFSIKYNYPTKLAKTGMIRHTKDLRLDLSERSFRWRASKAFNALPEETRNVSTLTEFKKEAKAWIKQNVHN